MSQKRIIMEDDELTFTSVLAEKQTSLSVKRTLMSADRCLMSWIRTGLTLIGFGFAIFEILQSLVHKNVTLTISSQGPKRVGLFLIAMGTFSLLLGGIQYWQIIQQVKKEFHYSSLRFPLLIAFLLFILGIVLFTSILVNIRII